MDLEKDVTETATVVTRAEVQQDKDSIKLQIAASNILYVEAE